MVFVALVGMLSIGLAWALPTSKVEIAAWMYCGLIFIGPEFTSAQKKSWQRREAVAEHQVEPNGAQ